MHGVTGKYRLDQRLGGGGMAEVFLGSTMGAEGFSRKVAIKRVLPGFSDNDAFSRMFVAEAQISSMLVHPNIVSVLDFDRDADRRLFLVMELVEGKDLDHLMSSGLLPTAVVIFVIGEVLRGLGYAHDLPVSTGLRGVVHRDISPHNVLLSWEGAVKVSDFGIAKARAASEATASVFIKGKPAYMSPEQANGEPLDGRSDLFAVGIMLWEMLIGRRLFTGEDTRATLAAVLFGQIPRPRSLRADIPKDLERVAMKLLERDVKSRYATAEEALVDILGCADAPKAGRELLTATLVDRFAAQAPVRQSLLKSRQSLPPVSAPTPNPYAPTHAPSLGAVMNAPTQTILPTRVGGGRGRTIAIAAAVIVIATAILVVAIVIGTRKRGGGDGIAAGGNDPPRDAAVADAAPPPPKTTEPPPAVVAVELAHAEEHGRETPPAAPPPGPEPPPKRPDPQKNNRDPRPGSADPPPAKKGTGTLVVRSDPPATVFINNVRRGETYFTIQLEEGTYAVKIENLDAHIHKEGSVTIRANQTTNFP
ncbi:MAG: serine/threonine protein kinase [Deltaproteobacteria bacterium]|nr:serine/threonine protein kinase [Deltaproteobacteria bacterium]MCW5802055.1 serine/threonine protein kinase [Deltaproteobacteria bacterium]